MSAVLSIDTTGATLAQKDTALLAWELFASRESVSRITISLTDEADEGFDPGTMIIEIWDDGSHSVGVFDRTGTLQGDWIW